MSGFDNPLQKAIDESDEGRRKLGGSMRPVPHQYTHRWNDLPDDQRHYLWPHAVESHILHLEQSRDKVVRAHKRLLADFDDQINACKQALADMERRECDKHN